MITMNRKQEIMAQITALLSQLIEVEETQQINSPTADKPVEMLTIKECAETVKGLSEHTVRQLVAQEKIPFVRTGQGKRGKILIPKSALLAYCGGAV